MIHLLDDGSSNTDADQIIGSKNALQQQHGRALSAASEQDELNSLAIVQRSSTIQSGNRKRKWFSRVEASYLAVNGIAFISAIITGGCFGHLPLMGLGCGIFALSTFVIGGFHKASEHDDYYATLEIRQSATQADIVAAYRSLALKFHPDRHRQSENEQEKEKARQEEDMHEEHVKRFKVSRANLNLNVKQTLFFNHFIRERF